ncbi:MAG: NAD(P)H-dependent glycerol-3-phosphate dehydrogenase [Dehalococcoidia bacterium]
MKRVAIVGTTTWGTTLGLILAQRGTLVRLLARSPEEAQELNARRENSRFLPGVPFPPRLTATSDSKAALHRAALLIFAVPSKALRQNVTWVRAALTTHPSLLVLSACKGLEKVSGKRMSQVLEEELPPALHSRICTLSGPNLALEIARGRPASTVVASLEEKTAVAVRDILMSSTFRVYTNTDIIGVELGGALKNIIAIGAGICDGLQYGNNAKAAFITRGLVEITRLGVAAGANPLTFAGLAGLGDLVATCTSPLSRNRYVGEQLAQGRRLQEVLASMQNVAEGVDTTAAALKMAQELGVEMPITQATYQVLFKERELQQAAMELMGRPPRHEWEGLHPV